MSDLKVCRICLRNELKFYHINKFNLKKYYEEITHKPLQEKDGLPKFVCYECATLLHKCHTFKEKCDHGEKVLTNILWSGPLTYTKINEINKSANGPKPLTLEVITVNKRVKTFNFQHPQVTQSTSTRQSTRSSKKPEPKSEVDTDYDDGPYSDRGNQSDAEKVKDEDVSVKKEEEEDDEEDLITLDKISPAKKKPEKKTPAKKTPAKKAPAKKTAAKKPAKETAKPKRRARRKKAKDTDTSSDDSDKSDIGETEVMSPAPKKNYKFDRARTGVKSLAFLESGFWKRSNFNEEDAMTEFHKRALDKKYLNAPFKCDLCYKGFSQKSMLDRHMPQKHAESIGNVVCRFCKMRFKHQRFLNKHLRRHYNKYECLRCGLVCCLENSALFHEEYHSGVKRKCPHCDKEFNHLSTFYTHLRTHRSKHMCSLCGESFVSEFGLHLHRKAKHAIEKDKEVNVEESIYCEVCKINFETKDAYQNHLAHSAMHTEENKLLGEYLIHEMLEEEEKREKGIDDKPDAPVGGLVNRKSMVEKELCKVRKQGKSRDSRKTAKKPTTCQHCGQAFVSLSAALRHHLANHRGRPFYAERVVCEVCGASLAVGSVAAHMNKHTQSKMYTCDTCGRSFTTSTVLKQHMVVHTGERKYVCSLCGKRFTQNGSLSLHVRTFHLKQPYPKRNRKTTDKEIEPDDSMAMSAAACSKAFGPKYVPSMYPWAPPK
ncbi:hypothetical protein ABMA27_009205 [Loxostege sticticalis]|uniref:Uncharacterized protein n=1 Tax=Loxostege sticticalis TaxID=481309 RepID=A0ABR3HA97_LOXSC